MKNSNLIGTGLALLAALFNGTVGVISVNLFASGLGPESVAFYKCLIALLVMLLYLIMTGRSEKLTSFCKSRWKALAMCGFFGFFMLYNFETAAYENTNVAVVVFCLFGTSTVITFILNAILERRRVYVTEALAMILSMTGLALIFLDSAEIKEAGLNGILYACLAGVGYGVFLVLTRYFNLGDGLVTVCGLMIFGVAFLAIPFAVQGGQLPVMAQLPVLLLLAVLPTIGGFLCTVRALALLPSQSVQLIELTEPLFALLFGFIFLGQLASGMQLAGGVLILLAILVHEYLANRQLVRVV